MAKNNAELKGASSAEKKSTKKEYKVIALSLGGKNNKIFHDGDVVTQEMLNSPAEELIKKGFLK